VTEIDEALAKTVRVTAVRVAMDLAMAARRGVDQVVPMALVAADPDADRKVAAVPKGAALVIVVRKVVVLMVDGADRMVLRPVVLVDRERVGRMAVPGAAPREAPVVDPEDLMVAVLAVADAVPTNMVLSPSFRKLMRSTANWIESSRKLNP